MQGEYGDRIAARALGHLGVPFRLHGRTPESGFDCIGLLADALQAVGFAKAIPAGYSLRGRFEHRAHLFFQVHNFQALERDQIAIVGDFSLVCTAPRQLHFTIHGRGGFIHAHAGLGRVVLTPYPVRWPTICTWRFIGD